MHEAVVCEGVRELRLIVVASCITVLVTLALFGVRLVLPTITLLLI